MKYRNWQIPYTAPQPPEALLRAGYSPLLAVLLALRGYADPVQARAFLSGGDQSAFDPMLLQDMDKAVARIRTAIERRENVAVFGDYDVDGITSTCVLTDYLRRQGVPVHPYIPDRIEEGYGLNMDAITNLQRTSDPARSTRTAGSRAWAWHISFCARSRAAATGCCANTATSSPSARWRT